MDFYAFHHFPAINPAQAENCVVYYLQYQVYGRYATGALDKVSKMLKPVTIHTMKVRSGESIREALKRIVTEVGQIQ
jgi:ketopantoate hydroxymethyltransferase